MHRSKGRVVVVLVVAVAVAVVAAVVAAVVVVVVVVVVVEVVVVVVVVLISGKSVIAVGARCIDVRANEVLGQGMLCTNCVPYVE